MTEITDPEEIPSDPSDEQGGEREDELEAGLEGEEESGGRIDPSDEMAAALADAVESVESRHSARSQSGQGANTTDKMTIEVLSAELQSTKEAYEAALAELEASKERALRLQAEFENFRRRSLKERQDSHRFGHENLVKDLLSAVDNLERAIAHTEQSDGGDLSSFLQGVELVYREILAAFAKHGVSVIEPAGEPFDPALHEAMVQVPTAEVPPNTVVDVFQKGYQLHDRMLRPARVTVAKAPETGGSGEQS